MKTIKFIIFLTLFLLISTILNPKVPTQAQDGDFFETFDDPALPGWEISQGVQIENGELILKKDMYAYYGAMWSENSIIISFRWEGSGAIAFHFQTGEAGSYLVQIHDKGIRLQLDQSGEIQEYANTSNLVSTYEWHSLVIDSISEIHSILVDEILVLEGIPPITLPPGGILIRAESESTGYITQVVVEGGEMLPPDQNNIEETPDLSKEEIPPENPQDLQSISDLTWIRLGGPPGGLGYDIRYNFKDPNIWYVTDQNAGVHISYDNGLTWQQSNTGIQKFGGAAGDGIPIFCLTVDPHNPDIIWSATAGNGQIYKSTDGGKSWLLKDKGIIHEDNINITFRGITVDPRGSDIVYAMAELIRQGNTGPDSRTGGEVYKSIDGGESWTRIWHGEPPSSLARYLWVNPENPDILYVSTGIFDASAVGEGNPDIDPEPFGGLGVLKSIDGGETWRVLGEQNGLKFRYIGSLFMHPDDPDILLAAAGRLFPELAGQYVNKMGYSPVGIYRTTDAGENWTQVLIPEKEILTQAFSSVDICPGDHNIVYAGSDFAVYRSNDGGITWNRTAGGSQGWGPPGVLAGAPIDLQCDPLNPDRVFSNNYSGGNFVSEDGGKTWKNLSSGYSGAQIINVAVDPSNPSLVYAAGRSGVWFSQDAGINWEGITDPGETKPVAGGECGAVAIDPKNNDHVILSCYSGIMERPTSSNVWVHQIHPPEIHPGISEMEFAPSNPSFVYATSANHNTMIHGDIYEDGRGIMASIDGGASWKVITGDLFKDAILTDVAVDPINEKVVYVASEIGLFKSSDGGASWIAPSTFLDGKPVRTVAVDLSDSNHILAGVQNMGLFVSHDGGVNWQQVTAGLEPNGVPRDIVFDPTTKDTVFLGDIFSGVYVSRDGGERWQKLSNGITNRAVTSLALSSDGLHLYAGTSGGGVFRLDLNGQPPVSALGSNATSTVPEPNTSETVTAIAPRSEPEIEPDSQKPIFPCLGTLLGLPLLVIGFSINHYRKRNTL
jgi:photosystem II stability/assembly factor-like uncharacterized protein